MTADGRAIVAIHVVGQCFLPPPARPMSQSHRVTNPPCTLYECSQVTGRTSEFLRRLTTRENDTRHGGPQLCEFSAARSPRMTSSSVGDSPRVLRTPCVNHLSPSPPECRHTKFEYVFLLCAAPARQTGPVQLLRQRLQQHGVHCWGRGRQCQCAWHAHRCRDSRGAWTVPQPPTGPQHPSTTSNTVAEHEEWVLQHAT